MSTTQTTEASDPLVEIRSTRDTARKIANEGPTDGADVTRVLAGLIAHLAEQIETLASGSLATIGGDVQQPDDDTSAA